MTPLTSSNNSFVVSITVHMRAGVLASAGNTPTVPMTGTITVRGNWSSEAVTSQHVEMTSAGDYNVTLELTATNVELWWPNTCVFSFFFLYYH